MMAAIARKALFWVLDAISGGPIRSHLRSIRQVTEDMSLLAGHQNARLRALLAHAVKTTQYYQGRDVRGGLAAFPVVDKNLIRDSFPRFRSSAFAGKKLKTMETSGSTGTPFKVVQDAGKRQRVLAELIYFNALVGYQVGDRHAFFRTLEPSSRKNAVKLFMQNEVEFDVRALDAEVFERQRQVLRGDRDIGILIGYSSVMYDLARHVIARGDTPASFGIKGVLCLSEPLYPKMRAAIRQAFDCLVLSRYSNQECGVLAAECPSCQRFHLDTASYFFEILELDGDRPAAPGAPGRIVVTDLYNYALPMIRYDTGDIGSVIPSDCARFRTPILKSLEGRRLDSIYDTAGRRLGSFVTDVIFESLGGSVRQFQFIQEAKASYRLRLCVDSAFAQERSVVEDLKGILGPDALINIDYVDGIPVLSSGKRKYVVNEYRPKDEDVHD
ncbi:MAG: hypothetical protein WC881_11195 [Elusimicrobiota bacterium]